MSDEIKLDLLSAGATTKKLPTSAVLEAEPIDLPIEESPTSAVLTKDVSDMPNDRDLVNQMLGQIQMANSFARFADVVSLQKLKYIKDNKVYKAVSGLSMTSPDGSKITDVGTWGGFCKALGLSVSKVDEDLLNLNTFGEEALKQLTSIGAGYRELRQYRKLDADDKTQLIEAAKAGDKEQLLDLAETLIERHVADKAQLQGQIDELTQDKESAGKRMNNMDAEIERQEMLIERLSKQQRITKFDRFTEDCRQESMILQAGVELNLNSLQKLFEASLLEANGSELKLCVEQVYIATCVAVSQGISIIEDMRSRLPDLPERVQGQHILTPEEAERWLLDFESIKNAHNAAAAARDIKRDADQPRGRGRPKAKAE